MKTKYSPRVKGRQLNILALFTICMVYWSLQGLAAGPATISRGKHTRKFTIADPGKIVGKVVDEKGEFLAGATIKVLELNRSLISGSDGSYTVSVPEGVYTLQVSFSSFNMRTVNNVRVVANQSTNLNITLQVNNNELDQVVVTALGIQKNKATLGYSTQKVDSKAITEARETNFVNALSGKIAGVEITNGSGNVGSSSRIVIRGENSFLNSEPLFVVDGVPIDNSNNKSSRDFRIDAGGARTAVDFGNAASDINPDDIESITILKGPNAAALYGSRAANGVVMITTKSGRSKKGVSINLGYSVENPLRLPRFQNVYGQGLNGQFKYVDGRGGGLYDGEDQSWGPKMDNGYSTTQFFSGGVEVPFNSYEDNVRDFFNTGNTRNANIAVSGSSQNSHYRVSFSNLNQNGIVPNTSFKKNSLSVNGGTTVGQLSFRTSITYVNSNTPNRMSGGYDDNNVMKQFLWGGRQVDYTKLKDYANADGTYKTWINFNNSPYFSLKENNNTSVKDHIFGNASATLKINSWINLMGRTGVDLYTDKHTLNRAKGTSDHQDGMYQNDIYIVREMNNDLLLTASRQLFNSIQVDLSAGGNIMNRRAETNSQLAIALVIPRVYNFANANGAVTSFNQIERKRMYSLYASADIAYKDYVYSNLAIRNDWSSTLPVQNNSYSYPSLSVGTNIVNYLKLNKNIISALKVRGSIAQAGADAQPYSLSTIYGITSWNNVAALTESNVLANANLKPEKTTAKEVGLDLGLFNNRISLEATYYVKNTTNQILSLANTPTAGYSRRNINAANIENNGIEAILTAKIVDQKNFNWDVQVNFNRNTNKIIEIAPGVDAFQLAAARANELFGVIVQAKVGDPVGTLYGRKFARSPSGEMIFSNGLPVLDATASPLGNYAPDFVGGFTNNVRYKSVFLSFTLSGKKGGKIASGTQAVGMRAGTLEESLVGREGGIVGQGVIKNADGTFKPNDVNVSAYNYYNAYYSFSSSEGYIFDASYLKLREVKIGYNLPVSLAGKIGASAASLILNARNVWIISSGTKHIDPETSITNDFTQGLEMLQIPSSRSIGLSLNVNF